MMLISVPKADYVVRWLLWTKCQGIRVDLPQKTLEAEELLIKALLYVYAFVRACFHMCAWENVPCTIILTLYLKDWIQ